MAKKFGKISCQLPEPLGCTVPWPPLISIYLKKAEPNILKMVSNHFIYNRALHNADFGDKKNQCISKTVHYGLLYGDSKNHVSAKFLHTLYTI